MIKRCLVVLVMSVVCTGMAMAQKKVDYRQSQARLIEPKMNVYVKPLIVELKVLEGQKRVEAGPFAFPDKDITTMTFEDLEKTKTNALYLATKKYDADVIVAATFDVRTPEKGKGLEIIVSGFPAVYTTWRTMEEKDYQWVREAYGLENKNTALEKVQALEQKK